MSLTKLPLAGYNLILFPAREGLVSDIPAADGKIIYIYLQCTVLNEEYMITVQSYINSFFAIRRDLSSCILPHFVLHGKEFRVVFSSAEWFGTEFREFASIFVPRNGIPSCFLFCRRVRNGNSDSILLFLFHGTEFRVVFSSAEGFGTEFREVSVPRNSRNSVGNNHLFRLFRLPSNLSEIPNPK
jgi:hypothetical protein